MVRGGLLDNGNPHPDSHDHLEPLALDWPEAEPITMRATDQPMRR
jgi:hypothetical protein